MKKILLVVLTISLLAIPAVAVAQAEGNLLSQGKSYTLVTPASAAYPDDDSFKLTDGVRGERVDDLYFKSPAYVGFNQANKDENGDFVIILDLGESYDNIKTLTLSYLAETDMGIYAPQSYSVYIADTAEGSYIHAGSVTIGEDNASGISKTGVASIELPQAVTAQYIKFVIHHQEAFERDGTPVTPGWVFIDEIEVYANTPVPQTNDDSLAVFIILAIISGSAWVGLKLRKHIA